MHTRYSSTLLPVQLKDSVELLFVVDENVLSATKQRGLSKGQQKKVLEKLEKLYKSETGKLKGLERLYEPTLYKAILDERQGILKCLKHIIKNATPNSSGNPILTDTESLRILGEYHQTANKAARKNASSHGAMLPVSFNDAVSSMLKIQGEMQLALVDAKDNARVLEVMELAEQNFAELTDIIDSTDFLAQLFVEVEQSSDIVASDAVEVWDATQALLGTLKEMLEESRHSCCELPFSLIAGLQEAKAEKVAELAVSGLAAGLEVAEGSPMSMEVETSAGVASDQEQEQDADLEVQEGAVGGAPPADEREEEKEERASEAPSTSQSQEEAEDEARRSEKGRRRRNWLQRAFQEVPKGAEDAKKKEAKPQKSWNTLLLRALDLAGVAVAGTLNMLSRFVDDALAKRRSERLRRTLGEDTRSRSESAPGTSAGETTPEPSGQTPPEPLGQTRSNLIRSISLPELTEAEKTRKDALEEALKEFSQPPVLPPKQKRYERKASGEVSEMVTPVPAPRTKYAKRASTEASGQASGEASSEPFRPVPAKRAKYAKLAETTASQGPLSEGVTQEAATSSSAGPSSAGPFEGIPRQEVCEAAEGLEGCQVTGSGQTTCVTESPATSTQQSTQQGDKKDQGPSK